LITKSFSLMAAEYILNLLMNDDRAEELSAYVKPYVNGREEGFTIVAYFTKTSKTITFSLDRNSDKIVIYSKLNKQGFPTNKAYKNARVFMPEQFGAAVDFIFHILGENDV
jgi:hypothetical protein